MKKKLAAVLAAVLTVCCIGGCGGSEAQETQNEQNVQDEQDIQAEQAVQEGTAETERKEDAAVLVVSFGTSYNDSRDLTIGAIEEAIAESCPEYEVRRAFTSQIIIDKLKDRDGLKIDNVAEALDRAVEDGIKELIVQPTHLMDGFEYNDLAKELTGYIDKFDRIVLGEPLLMSDADFDAVVQAITEKTTSYDDGETAVCFMGHGTEAASNAVYAKLQNRLKEAGYENYYVGTVEGTPTLEDVTAALKEKGTYKKVVLLPLMVVAGDHANNDMAGAEDDSWKTVLEKEGYEVTCVLEGLGQIEAIQDIYVAHIRSAIESGAEFEGVELPEESAGTTELADGTYSIAVESNSSMFWVEKAQLTVADGEMTAVITLGGTGYGKLYMGTGEQAAVADEADYIPYVEDAEGAYTYTIPVTALDQPIDCAAFSIKKEEWYDRQLTFLSSSVSDAADGTYRIDVTLSGGSGKASVSSPASIVISGDSMTARIEWSSPDYDYMLVDGEKYLPVNTEGNSVFEIPVSELDAELNVTADTVAMSKPHEIEYTLTFHSDTLKPAE